MLAIKQTQFQSIYTCQTLKEYVKSKKKNTKFKYFSKSSYPIYKDLELKLNLENKEFLINYIQNEFKQKKYSVLPWKYFELPEQISNILESKFSITQYKFYNSKYVINNNLNESIMNLIIKNIFPFNNTIQITLFLRNIKYIFEELNLNFGLFKPRFNSDLDLDLGFDLDIESQIILKFELIKNLYLNSIQIYSSDFSQVIIINQLETILISKNFILSFNKLSNQNYNFIFINNNTFYSNLPNNIILYLKYSLDLNMVNSYGFIKNKEKKELINITSDSNGDFKVKYNFVNVETKLKIKSSSISKSSGEQICIYNKLGCDFFEYYNPNKKIHNIISQCAGEDSKTGLRYRGQYSQKNQSNGKIRRTITYNDEIKFDKEGSEIKVDLLENQPPNPDEFVIGWKIAKSAGGELRIIKLGIQPEAKKIRPIDEEYFITFGKERCEKAIVMDIQLPDYEKEISVVPEELSAFSYVYRTEPNLKFEYKVGSEVFPDKFDPNEDIGCSQGIHYYRDRSKVFKAFVDDN